MKKIKNAIVLLLPIFIFILIFGLNFPPVADEKSYFITSKLFGESLPNIDFKNYYADSKEFIGSNTPIVATPPLSIILYGLTGKLFGYDLWKLRTLSVLFGIVLIFTFYKILNDLHIKHPKIKTLIFLLYPYTLLNVFVAQSDIIALTFFVLSLRFFLRNKKHDMLYASVFSTLAVFTRQDYVVIVPAMATSFLIINQKNIWKNPESLRKLLYIAMPLLLITPLLLYWGGLFPSSYSALEGLKDTHKLSVSFEKFIFFFVLIGAFFIPLLYGTKLKLNKGHLFIILLAILFLFFPINFNNCEGIVCKVGSYLGNYSNSLYFILMLIGGYIFFNQINILKKDDKIMFTYIFWFLAASALTSVLRQRYYLYFIPLLTLQFYKNYDNKKILTLWILALLSMSLLYIYYKLFIRSF